MDNKIEPGTLVKEVLGKTVAEALAGKEIKDINVVADRTVTYCRKFDRSSEDFAAVNEAEGFLKQKGYTVGRMCSPAPIGFADGNYDYVAKWWNISRDEYKFLSGMIIADGDFRSGDIYVLFFTDDIFNK